MAAYSSLFHPTIYIHSKLPSPLKMELEPEVGIWYETGFVVGVGGRKLEDGLEAQWFSLRHRNGSGKQKCRRYSNCLS